LLLHCFSSSSCCAALLSSRRSGLLLRRLLTYRTLVVSSSHRATLFCLVAPAGCRILAGPPSHPLIVPAGYCIASPCAPLSSSRCAGHLRLANALLQSIVDAIKHRRMLLLPSNTKSRIYSPPLPQLPSIATGKRQGTPSSIAAIKCCCPPLPPATAGVNCHLLLEIVCLHSPLPLLSNAAAAIERPPPPPPLNAFFIVHQHRHCSHRYRRRRHRRFRPHHRCPLTKKEAEAVPPQVYQRQHHRENITSPDKFDLFNFSTVFEI